MDDSIGDSERVTRLRVELLDPVRASCPTLARYVSVAASRLLANDVFLSMGTAS